MLGKELKTVLSYSNSAKEGNLRQNDGARGRVADSHRVCRLGFFKEG